MNIPNRLVTAAPPIALLLVALAHAVPAAAFFNAGLLENFYGVRNIGADLEALLRHRALLFGIVAGLLALGAVRRAYRRLALGVGWLSVGAFIYLAVTIPGTNALIVRVMHVDVGLAAALAIAAGFSAAERRPAGAAFLPHVRRGHSAAGATRPRSDEQAL